MKTVTFSNDQASDVRLALRDRILTIERILRAIEHPDMDPADREPLQMYYRVQLDVMRQALDLMEG